MAHDFDPKAPPPPLLGINPMFDYSQVPVGLSAAAVGQFLIACLLVVQLWLAPAVVKAWSSKQWALACYPIVVFAASGLGMALRRGWGWWLTCAIYYYVFFNIPVALVLWTTRDQDKAFNLLDHLIVAGLAIFLLTYLNRPELLRFIRFGSADGRAKPWMRLSPAVVGGAGAAIRLVIELTKN